jgi:hypothetical protein
MAHQAPKQSPLCPNNTKWHHFRFVSAPLNPSRIQVNLVKPDLALVLTWWSVSFASSKQKMVGK